MNKKTNINQSFCSRCNVSILTITSESTGGLCMPCFKAENGGRTPHNIRYIGHHGLLDIEQKWQHFQKMKFPRELGGADVANICVTSLDSVVAGCISTALYVENGSKILDDDRDKTLRSGISDLQVVLENVPIEAKEYFSALLCLAKAVIEVQDQA